MNSVLTHHLSRYNYEKRCACWIDFHGICNAVPCSLLCRMHEPGAGRSHGGTHTAAATTAEPQTLVIATTTSLYDTKLLDYLQPKFETEVQCQAENTSQGTGKAIELAKNGDADVLLVHSPSQELTFMKDGYGLNRRSFASNSFMIVGPAADPAGIKNMTPERRLHNPRPERHQQDGRHLHSSPVATVPGPIPLRRMSGPKPGTTTPPRSRSPGTGI